MPVFSHFAARFRASKTRNGLIFVALPLGNEIVQWTRCRLVRLHEAPNRATAQKEAPQTELSCTPIPPTQFVGYILRSPSYIISVRVSVSVRLGEISKPRLVQVSIVFKGSLSSLADYLSRCTPKGAYPFGLALFVAAFKLGTRRPPRRLAFDARSLRLAQTSH